MRKTLLESLYIFGYTVNAVWAQESSTEMCVWFWSGLYQRWCQPRSCAFSKFSSWLYPLVRFTATLVLTTCGILFLFILITANQSPIEYSSEIIALCEYYNQIANISLLFYSRSKSPFRMLQAQATNIFWQPNIYPVQCLVTLFHISHLQCL